MISVDRISQIKFNASELVSILADEDFDYLRAGRWLDDHVLFTLQHILLIAQASLLYLITIFSIKRWMRHKEPFKLRLPVAAWNFSMALVSGLCTAAMTADYYESTITKGFHASLCSTREEFFSGTNGFALIVVVLAKLPQFLDTLFIVLRKQPLLFFHYYHHALTLCFSWFTYSGFSPSGRHVVYFNALIHTVLYSYFFLTSLSFRPPRIIGKCIVLAEILHFFFILYVAIHLTVIAFVFQEPCDFDIPSLILTWCMDLSYLYLFIDFFMRNNKKRANKSSQKGKKTE